MFRKLPPLKALRAFEAAARHRSFSEAAMELSVTQGAISYQVKQLEGSIDTELFHRRTRQVELTSAGQSLYLLIHRQFKELEEEIHRIAPTAEQLILTVSVSTYFVTRWLSQRLGMFLNAHPQITLRLQHSVNDPGFTLEDTDMAIRWGDGTGLNSQAELLISLPMIAVCAPSLLQSANGIRRLNDLRQHTFLHDQKGMDRWSEWLQLAGLKDLGAGVGPVIDDPNVRVQSAIDGHGLVLGNGMMQSEIDLGRLAEPFDIRLEGYGYYLIYGEHAPRRESFRLFRRWLQQQAAIFQGISID